MDESKPVGTPADPSQKLLKTSDDEECVDQQKYQSLVGSLLYLSVCTRPDITFAVSTLAKFSAKPAQRHWTAAKRVLRYLRGRKKNQDSLVFLMQIGQETKTTENQSQAIFFMLEVVQYPGRARNRTV